MEQKRNRPGIYIEISGLKLPREPEPVPFGRYNDEYPGCLEVLADLARKHCGDGLSLIMGESLRAEAEANGEKERMEEITGLKIATRKDFPNGYVAVGRICKNDTVEVFPGVICVY